MHCAEFFSRREFGCNSRAAKHLRNIMVIHAIHHSFTRAVGDRQLPLPRVGIY
jgi:hypothetical protein